MTYFRLSIVFSWRREYHVGEILGKSSMDTTKGYFTQRNVVRNGIRTKHQIFRISIFILVYINTFHFKFCQHSGKPLYSERRIVQLTLSPGTD